MPAPVGISSAPTHATSCSPCPCTDTVIVRGTDIAITDSTDTLISFEDRGRNVALDNGVLYVMGGGNINIIEQNGVISVVQDGQVSTFNSADVNFIAGIGDPVNDDVFFNNTSKQSFYDGAGGNDILIGGSARDILKGGCRRRPHLRQRRQRRHLR